MEISKSMKYYLHGVWKRTGDHNILFMAEALSFSILVCIVPFVLIGFSVGGLILEESDFLRKLDTFIDVVVPYPENARFVKEIVAAQADEFLFYKNLAGTLGFVGLLFASSALFSTIRSIFGSVYPVKKARSVVVSKLFDLMMILVVMVLFLVAATLLPVVQVFEHLAGESGLFGGVIIARLEPLLLEAGSIVAVVIVLFLVHRLVPVTRPPKGAALVAALSTTILWFAAQQLFGAYIAHVATFKKIYGAYVAAIVVVFWIYYTAIVFIIGAEIGQLYRERREKHSAGL